MNLTEFPTYEPGPFADNTTVEVRNEGLPSGRIRSALFDFDGTISLIRTGWQDIMIPMMVEILRDAGDEQTEDSLTLYIREYVDRLTGKQTIFQMMQLAEEVERLGGNALDPLDYKQIYNDRLMERIESLSISRLSGRSGPRMCSWPRNSSNVRGRMRVASGASVGVSASAMSNRSIAGVNPLPWALRSARRPR